MSHHRWWKRRKIWKWLKMIIQWIVALLPEQAPNARRVLLKELVLKESDRLKFYKCIWQSKEINILYMVFQRNDTVAQVQVLSIYKFCCHNVQRETQYSSKKQIKRWKQWSLTMSYTCYVEIEILLLGILSAYAYIPCSY